MFVLSSAESNELTWPWVGEEDELGVVEQPSNRDNLYYAPLGSSTMQVSISNSPDNPDNPEYLYSFL